LTADALTTDPEGMAFLRDVLAQGSAADAIVIAGERASAATKRRSRPRQERDLSERKLGAAPLTPAPVVEAAA
jgi:hypothetical protein